ncbi:MotA/TolQ/ExbB proton channel family protein [Salinicola sp. DM10]|uniref:MotA/TolQ/ExbB proton channel family protein n=1 Tax=Salinicola sp. DM10 TaxID=2815721 RepID=UPI001E35328A|nr:MotA/TolQ/ExbB proton channel family protein [Salinicola sp. DM10]MCE3025486.1 MotA/TolQ/ExbB proton channel family protein [Salinicola sp. DM10]
MKQHSFVSRGQSLLIALMLAAPVAQAQDPAAPDAQDATASQSSSTQAQAEAPNTLQQVLARFQADSREAEARDDARLAALVDDRQKLDAAVADAERRLSAAQAKREELEQRQREQRQTLADLGQQRGGDAADIEAVSQVIKQQAGELRDALSDSWLTLGGAAQLPPRLDDRGLVDIDTLDRLRGDLAALIAESARGVSFEAPVAAANGDVKVRPVVRLGDSVAFSQGDLLARDSDAKLPLDVFPRTPGDVRAALRDFQAGQGERFFFDPTDGEVLQAIAQQPSLWQRFQQGGYVGYVIVGLGAIGLLVALAQYLYLLRVSSRMQRQLRDPERLRDDNPLGRVLGRFGALGPSHAPEALEARLDEALLAEQPRLERGQPIVKLIAAVAPLLGLLGTVTGMIITFQSITVFGTGDPQLMAGGISQALVTTVLGLITAVPLLFVNTALSSRSRRLVGLLEGRASAVLAEHLEAAGQDQESHRGVHA